jgi:hypothetical protein
VISGRSLLTIDSIAMIRTRFCVVPDPIFPDGESNDLAAFFVPEDPKLPLVLGATGIASTPIFETTLAFEALTEIGFQREFVQKTSARVYAAPGYAVEEEQDPYDM